MTAMNLPIFTDSLACRGRKHCATCRSLGNDGISFRRSTAKYSAGIGDGIACPHGVPWDWKPTPGEPRRPPPPAAATEEERGGPGDLVKSVLSAMGVTARPDCGCEAMRRRMNEWGYRGCWNNRQEIEEWFRAKAAEQGVAFSVVSLWRWITTGSITSIE